MQLALQTDYALRSLIYLAGRPGRHKVADIAKYFRISRDHVAKVVHRLAKLGYVRSIRGMGGGLEIARTPEEISIGEVVLAMEGNTHLLECVKRRAKGVGPAIGRTRRTAIEAAKSSRRYASDIAWHVSRTNIDCRRRRLCSG